METWFSLLLGTVNKIAVPPHSRKHCSWKQSKEILYVPAWRALWTSSQVKSVRFRIVCITYHLYSKMQSIYYLGNITHNLMALVVYEKGS